LKTLTIIKPEDWHLHLREGLVLKNIIHFTSEYFGRAIVMPNTKSPITSINRAISYKKSIVEALPESSKFEPLMTMYLTDETDKTELINGFKNNIFFAAKLYPANATTNSSHGVKKIENLYEIFESMEDFGMPLLIHGEVTDNEVDIFDREEVFIDRELSPGIIIGSKIAPIFFNTAQDSGALPIEADVSQMKTGDVIKIYPYEGIIKKIVKDSNTEELISKFDLFPSTLTDEILAGGRINLMFGRSLTD